ncbi:hypothetical protein ABEF95_012256 [Exophiala dermatitidis]
MEFYGMTGEKLGTIGQVDKGKKDTNADADAVHDDDLPQWKRDFLQKPSISTRRGIAWGYSPPYEDTDTIVLTSPKAVFVDIRLPLRSAPTDPLEPLASDPAFWAFSGTASSTFYDRDAETETETGYQKGSVDSAAPAPSLSVAMPYTAHAVFRHEIDSKGPGISDEGDMFLLPNGDCVEVGMMHNPRTNRVEMYKEYWTAPSPAAAAQDQGQGQLPRTPCVVAKTLDLRGRGAAAEHVENGKGGEIGEIKTESGAPVGAGVVIRVGDYCQGIVQRGQQTVLVERWQKTQVQGQISNSRGSNGGVPVGGDGDRGDGVAAEWTKDRRSNTPNEDISMPCQWLCADTRELGDQIVIHGVTWSVVEVGA